MFEFSNKWSQFKITKLDCSYYRDLSQFVDFLGRIPDELGASTVFDLHNIQVDRYNTHFNYFVPDTHATSSSLSSSRMAAVYSCIPMSATTLQLSGDAALLCSLVLIHI